MGSENAKILTLFHTPVAFRGWPATAAVCLHVPGTFLQERSGDEGLSRFSRIFQAIGP